MRKLVVLVSALALLLGCNQERLVVVPDPEPQQQTVVDLSSMSYEQVMTLLADRTSLEAVTFTDGGLSKTVSLAASEAVDPTQAQMLLFEAPAHDSVDLTVTPEYLSVRMTASGTQYAWLAYANPESQILLAERYRSLGGVEQTSKGQSRSAAEGMLRLNLTKMAEQVVASGNYELPEPAPLPEHNSTQAKGAQGDLFQKIVSIFYRPAVSKAGTAVVNLYMLREKGANPANHEIQWQVNDAIQSLTDVHKNVRFNVQIMNCDFKGSNNPDATLSEFANWAQAYYVTGRKMRGIFMLCRWSGWPGVLGVGYMDTYDVNRSNSVGFGITCTNAWNKYVMAHEIGHIFGADHIKASWWQLFSSDLMVTNSSDWLGSGKHKDKTNRAILTKTLKLR